MITNKHFNSKLDYNKIIKSTPPSQGRNYTPLGSQYTCVMSKFHWSLDFKTIPAYSAVFISLCPVDSLHIIYITQIYPPLPAIYHVILLSLMAIRALGMPFQVYITKYITRPANSFSFFFQIYQGHCSDSTTFNEIIFFSDLYEGGGSATGLRVCRSHL